MTYLPDANVWIALAVGQHVHHQAAQRWLQGCPNDTIAFCRVTEMALLRLLTNAAVLGSDVLTPIEAWAVRDALADDDRVIFLPEPSGFDALWRRGSARPRGGRNFWTDAWLLAFCEATPCRLVTFDQALRSHGKERVRLLDAGVE
mgnify:CR=1 FL=1